MLGQGTDDVASQATRLARMEAVLFLSREPLGSRKLAQLANLSDGTEARTLMRRLNEQYDAEGRAFRVEEIAQGYHLLTRPKFAPWLRRLTGTDTAVRFSHPALETLAVVAYRQPVLRAEIESVRGVQCGEILRQLMERSMVRIVGRADELGRPMLYGTTRQFLQTFGLKHLDDLPRADQLRRGDVAPEASEMSNDTELGTTGEEQETSDMTLDSEAAPATAAELDDDLMEDEVFDEDIESEDDYDDPDDADDDSDDFEDGEWQEVDDEDADGGDAGAEKFDGDKEDLDSDDWDDEGDDWDEGDDDWDDEKDD